MITSAQALEEIEAMEREAAAAHDPAHMGFSGTISTVVLDRALQIARDALAEVERLELESGTEIAALLVKAQTLTEENERLLTKIAAYEAPSGWRSLYAADAIRVLGDPTVSVGGAAFDPVARAVLGDQT